MVKNATEEFGKVFDEEYICLRNRNVHAVFENGRYEDDIDILVMIQTRQKLR